ncbi:MAG: FMN-binding glutamate synthase family protein [Verrucomicrobia bacterium]|nr:FMN-binding glutamate synthase family protein [Verrucomicrobiota bacterium]MDA1068164.1 FMN-binding glutamate synthase family protein [Verrucomicrobiota bacterium]
MTSLSIDLYRLSKFTNFALPLLAILFFIAGITISFYFNFLTVAFLFLTIVNVFYLKVQTEHSLLRNFGILAQGRYILESIGPELRQYLFASDTEERPFNRTERVEIYRKAKNMDSASSFGSMKEFDTSEIKIRHSMYPMDRENLEPYSLTFGEERGIRNTYTITRPLIISAMSFGSLGENAIHALARGAKMAGIPMNTGEGGFPKHHLKEGCDLIFQMGTAKFGVRDAQGFLDEQKLKDLAGIEQIKMIEIKLSQGAKPGKGGLLPKEKITPEIAELRGVSLNQDVVSPPRHKECKDEATTVAFIRKVQEVSGLPVGIKFCVGSFTEVKALVQEMITQDAFPDYISVDGSEGGTGAAPKAFMDQVGVPLYPALSGVNKILCKAGVRDRLKLLAAGKLINPGRQMLAFALGAQAIYSARGFMLALGCIQAMQCGKNTCPIGITTHDPSLQKGLDVATKSIRIKNYVQNIEHELIELLSATGQPSFESLTMKNLYVPENSTLAPLLDHTTRQLSNL